MRTIFPDDNADFRGSEIKSALIRVICGKQKMKEMKNISQRDTENTQRTTEIKRYSV